MNTVGGSSRSPSGGARIVAVLGPTNTGKTHLALERMLAHRSGMIGFPLRLLARENYDKIVRLKGRDSVALITGEERILPPNPRWFVCTVEAMPPIGPGTGREVAFLAIDEIQMAADRERGHVFTDRLLHARGYAETMFLGAETAKRLIRALVPGVEFIARPRFSTLSWTGPKKITRLPRRSAAVAFSAAEVYGMAELVRRQRGGAAVVFGALSPRTRNAQVAMYQAGEVDFLVATDAIGMGLNMDIDHIAFAQLAKFDGRGMRRLTPAELGQIAGRAGRHMNDGTFGTTTSVGGRELGALDPETITAIEEHRFPPLQAFQWRNSDLDFATPGRLLSSLDAPPPLPVLFRTREADDHLTLAALARDPGIAELRGERDMRLLWETCQIPDFRKALGDAHVNLVSRIFGHLRNDGRLPTDWIASQIARLSNVEGDIDTLLERLARIRTWTYVSHRPHWLADAEQWQARAREVEDRLSDVLHERLTQRFVDRRAAALSRARKAGKSSFAAAVNDQGEVLVEGEFTGKLEGFNFVADAEARDSGGRDLLAAANKALRRDAGERVRSFLAAGDDAFTLDERGFVRWQGQPVGKLIAGDTPLGPRVSILPADLLEARHRDDVRRRLQGWVDAYLTRALAPLCALRDAPLTGAARGLAFELVLRLGCVARRDVTAQLDALGKRDRGALHALGLHIGQAAVYMPALRAQESTALRALLWACANGKEPAEIRAAIPRQRSIPRGAASLPAGFYNACLYLLTGPVVVRADCLEGLAGRLRGLAKLGPFAATRDFAAAIGVAENNLAGVLAALGYRAMPGMVFVPRPERRVENRPEQAADDASPFASLRRLKPR